MNKANKKKNSLFNSYWGVQSDRDDTVPTVGEESVNKDNDVSVKKEAAPQKEVSEKRSNSSVAKRSAASERTVQTAPPKTSSNSYGIKRTFVIDEKTWEDFEILLQIQKGKQRDKINELLSAEVEKNRDKIEQYKQLFR